MFYLQKFYLQKSLIQTFRTIKEKKWLFLSLLMVEVLFLILFFAFTLNYQINIFQDLEKVMNPLAEIEAPTAGATYEQFPLESFLEMQASVNSLMKHVGQFFLLIALIYFLLEGIIWSVLSLIREKKIIPKDLLKNWLKFFFFTLLFLVLFALLSAIFLFLLKDSLSPEKFTFFGQIELIFFFVCAYFLALGYGLLHYTPKKIFKNLWSSGLKRIYLVLPVILIKVLLLSLVAIGFYFSTAYSSFLGLIFSVLGLVLVVLFSKIFWINSLEEIKS